VSLVGRALLQGIGMGPCPSVKLPSASTHNGIKRPDRIEAFMWPIVSDVVTSMEAYSSSTLPQEEAPFVFIVGLFGDQDNLRSGQNWAAAVDTFCRPIFRSGHCRAIKIGIKPRPSPQGRSAFPITAPKARS
jgi:hypothetical protein